LRMPFSGRSAQPKPVRDHGQPGGSTCVDEWW
jgi:hypothetical protein